MQLQNIYSHAESKQLRNLEYAIPSPVLHSYIDKIINQLYLPAKKMSLIGYNSAFNLEQSITIVHFENQQQKNQCSSTQINTQNYQFSQILSQNQVGLQKIIDKIPFRIRSKNVLSNLRKPILRFFSQYQPIQSTALDNLRQLKHVTRDTITQLFDDQTLTHVFREMFQTKYLKRQFFFSRSEKKEFRNHFHVIRQLHKQFICRRNDQKSKRKK